MSIEPQADTDSAVREPRLNIGLGGASSVRSHLLIGCGSTQTFSGWSPGNDEVAFHDPLTIRWPSGLNATQDTASMCPLSVRLLWLSVAFQTFSVPSPDPLTIN